MEPQAEAVGENYMGQFMKTGAYQKGMPDEDVLEIPKSETECIRL